MSSEDIDHYFAGTQRPDVWLITGIPGAGKTTTARHLALQLRRGVHIEGDRLQEMIISGAVWPGESPEEEAERQIQLNVLNQCLLAQSFRNSGFTPVLDYVASTRARLAEFEQHLAPLTLQVVILSPAISVALQRDADRPEKQVAKQWAWLEPVFDRELREFGIWVDNSSMAVEDVVNLLLSGENERHLPFTDRPGS